MAKAGSESSIAPKNTAGRRKSTGAGSKKPSTQAGRQQDMYRSNLSLCSGDRNYGMFSEGASNAPYAGCLSQKDTKPCAEEEGKMVMGDDEAEEDICPSDELEELMMQEVATYRKKPDGRS